MAYLFTPSILDHLIRICPEAVQDSVTEGAGYRTLTLHSAVKPPSFVLAVTSAVPGAFAFTLPSLTVTIFSSLLFHCTVRSEAL